MAGGCDHEPADNSEPITSVVPFDHHEISR